MYYYEPPMPPQVGSIQPMPYQPNMIMGFNQPQFMPHGPGGNLQFQSLPSTPTYSSSQMYNPYNFPQQIPVFNPGVQVFHQGWSVAPSSQFSDQNNMSQNPQTQFKPILGRKVKMFSDSHRHQSPPMPQNPKMPQNPPMHQNPPPGLRTRHAFRRNSVSSTASYPSSTNTESCHSNKMPYFRPNYPHWPKFTGRGRWSVFLMQWQAVAKLHKIQGDEKLFSLIACIKGKAANYMVDLPSFIKSSFDRLVTEMELMFETVKGDGKYVDEYRDELSQSKQGNLSPTQYAFHVATLANKCKFDQILKVKENPDKLGEYMSKCDYIDTIAGEAFLRGASNQFCVKQIRAYYGKDYPDGIPLPVAMEEYKIALVIFKNHSAYKPTTPKNDLIFDDICDTSDYDDSNSMDSDNDVSKISNFKKPRVKRYAKFIGRRLKQKVAKIANEVNSVTVSSQIMSKSKESNTSRNLVCSTHSQNEIDPELQYKTNYLVRTLADMVSNLIQYVSQIQAESSQFQPEGEEIGLSEQYG